jgi:uncharacterized protein (DUF3820 family)
MFDQEDLLQLAQTTMPFGKYQGWLLIDLPEPYLLWFADEGFPNGILGRLLALALQIKINGLEHLIEPLKPAGLRVPARCARPKLRVVQK